MYKVTVIQGLPGLGKSTLAREIAVGDFVISTWHETQNNLASLLSGGITTVIVDDVTPTQDVLDRIKELATEKKIKVHKKGVGQQLIDTPNFIFVMHSTQPLPFSELNRHINLITL